MDNNEANKKRKDDIRVMPEMKPIVLSQTLEITRVPRKMEAGECILLLLEVIFIFMISLFRAITRAISSISTLGLLHDLGLWCHVITLAS